MNLILKKRILIKISITIFITGVIVDFLSYQTNSLIVVGDEFINYVYTAIVTVAALSPTILTIVINSFDEKYSGYSIKEIVNFKNDYLRISEIIPICLFSILLSTWILSLGFLNTLVGILTVVILVISSVSLYTWRIISEEEFCNDRVSNEIDCVIEKDNLEEYEVLIKRMFNSFNISIETYGASNIDYYINLIIETIRKHKRANKMSLLIDKELKRTFKTVSNSIGFVPAIDKILAIYTTIGLEYINYDKREMLIHQIENVQYFNDKELSSSSMIEISKGLEELDTIADEDKVLILYQYFKNLYLNNIISKRVRKQLLEDLLNHLTEFRYSNENNYDYVKQKSLLQIVKYFILLNKEIKDAEEILVTIANALYAQRYSRSDKMFETIAIIYLAIYLYSELERETLAEEHRKKLKELIQYHEKDIHTSKVSFRIVLEIYFEDIVKALWNLSEQTYRDFSFLEYFPPQSGAKSIVWDIRTGIGFATLNYFLTDYNLMFPPTKMISNWDNIENKKLYINSMMFFFDHTKKTITDSTLMKIDKLSEWIGIRSSISIENQKEMFDILNNELEILEDIDFGKTVDLRIETNKINSFIKQRFQETHHYYGYDESISIKDAEERQFRPKVVDLTYCSNESIVSERLAGYIEGFISEQIKKELAVVNMSFDIDGVKTLLDHLRGSSFDRRNYPFIDIWASRKQVSETHEYKELASVILGINNQDTRPINTKVFFKDGCLNYNMEITDYHYEKLSDEECSIYTERFKVGEGLYKLRDAYLNKSKAMDLINKGYRKEVVSFKFKSNIKRDSGIIIEFKR